jgi:hypothetical protein
MGPFAPGSTHVVIPGSLADVKVELDAGVRPLVSPWKLNPRRRDGTVTLDIDIEAMGENCGAPITELL